jgi:hypothetical protein
MWTIYLSSQSINTLGYVWFNSKLTLDSQINHLLKKANFITSKLYPLLKQVTLSYCINLWRVFLQPLFEFTLPLYVNESSQARKMKLKTILNKTFKGMTLLKKNVPEVYIEKLREYDLDQLSNRSKLVNEDKWISRKQGQVYMPNPEIEFLESSTSFLPKCLVELLNKYTMICPKCEGKTIMTAKHLSSRHGVELTDPLVLIKEMQEVDGPHRKQKLWMNTVRLHRELAFVKKFLSQ